MRRSLQGWSRRGAALAATAFALAAAGCSLDAVNSPRPAAMVTVSGNNQTVPVGGTATTPLRVRVTDQDRNAVSGVTVTWAVESGGGRVASASTTTDSSGETTNTYTAGTTTGLATVKASVSGLGSVSFTITVGASTGS